MQAAQSWMSVKHSSLDFGGSNPSLSTNTLMSSNGRNPVFQTDVDAGSIPVISTMLLSSNGQESGFSNRCKCGFDPRQEHKILVSSLDGKSTCLIHMR